MSAPVKIPAMRDALIDRIRQAMPANPDIFFVSADFGSPVLDHLREEHPDRFLNVGIAEQNMINVSAGLALEGYRVYAYAIAVFATLRCYEQIRVNLSILSQERPMNVNIVGVGAGVSYDVSGPTHHCLEDITLMRLLPNIDVTSPADHPTAVSWADFTIRHPGIHYIRLDSKPQPVLEPAAADFEKGWRSLKAGRKVAVLATGYMCHKALRVAAGLEAQGITCTVIDVFRLAALDRAGLAAEMARHEHLISLEEGFVGRGGLDRLMIEISGRMIDPMGFPPHYHFDIGSREFIHHTAGVGEEHLAEKIQALWKQ